jgi:hypothetical protein
LGLYYWVGVQYALDIREALATQEPG